MEILIVLLSSDHVIQLCQHTNWACQGADIRIIMVIGCDPARVAYWYTVYIKHQFISFHRYTKINQEEWHSVSYYFLPQFILKYCL